VGFPEYRPPQEEVAMNIRLLQESDLDSIAQLYVKAYKDHHAEETVESAKPYLEKFFRFEPEGCYVADDEGTIAGAILAYSYQKFGRPVLFLQELFVDPEGRHKGVGRQLVARLREGFADAAVKVVPLIKADTAVLNFYNSLGFEQEQVFSFGFDD
jgi:ribosomal protein S18 acetylase RimI-like enzyme